jgi:hypothetical protein
MIGVRDQLQGELDRFESSALAVSTAKLEADHHSMKYTYLGKSTSYLGMFLL